MNKDLAAVKENGYALEFVENQTKKICKAAVKQKGNALYHVTNQTNEVCKEAVRQNKNAKQLIKEFPMIKTKQIGPFMVLRIFVPETTEYMTLFSLFGKIWVQPPEWVVNRYWPEEKVNE